MIIGAHCSAMGFAGSVAGNGPTMCTGSEQPDYSSYIMVPKTTALATFTMAAAMAAIKFMPTAEKSAKAEKDHTKMTSIITSLKEVLDVTQNIIDETEDLQEHRKKYQEKLPISRLLMAVKTLKEGHDKQQEANPKYLPEAVAAMGGRSVTAEEIKDLREFLPLAMGAYDEAEDLEQMLKKKGLQLLYHDATTDVGRTSHFVALDHTAKRIIVGIKGTSDLNDVLTDAVCKPVALYKTDSKKEQLMAMNTVNTAAQAHDAIAVAAHSLKERLGFVLKVFVEPQGYEVVTTGHSLGAGTAALLAILLKEEMGLRHVRAVAFATPAVADKATALGSKRYVTTMVHHLDCVPCASVGNLVVLNEVLNEIDKLGAEGGKGVEKITKTAVQNHKAGSKELFVPGKVIYAFHDTAGKYDAVVADGTFPMLKTIHISPTMITDHLGDGYTGALAGLP